MRVVAGTARGRRLVAPDGQDTRPTSDRVRESIFNALHSLDAIDGASVVDLFAGSGALGIEALSRGAAPLHVRRDLPRALGAIIRDNLAGPAWPTGPPSRPASVDAYLLARPGPFDLALCDPPYAFDGWPALSPRCRRVARRVRVEPPAGAGRPVACYQVEALRRYRGDVRPAGR